jgi:hypothetical protein
MISISGYKYLPVARLIELLSQLEGSIKIAPNEVGNLLIIQDYTAVGFIDFAGSGEIDFWGPE